MFAFFAESDYAACPECGASVLRAEADDHLCEHGRWVDFQMLKARGELDVLELEVFAYLRTPRGRFEAWYAERERKAA